MHTHSPFLMTLPPLVLARLALVIFAFLFLIGFKRRQRLCAIRKSGGEAFVAAANELITSDLSENRMQLILFGFFSAVLLAYLVYTIFVPSAAAL